MILFIRLVIEEQELVLGDIELRRDLVLVGAYEAGDATFDELDGCGAPCLAVVSEGSVLSPGEFESDRVVLVTGTGSFVLFGFAHDDLY